MLNFDKIILIDSAVGAFTKCNFGTVMLDNHKCVLLNRLKCEPDSNIVIKYLVE